MASTLTVSNIYAVSTTIQSNLYVPFIYNSALQTSSIMASTVTASNINVLGDINYTGILLNNGNPIRGTVEGINSAGNVGINTVVSPDYSLNVSGGIWTSSLSAVSTTLQSNLYVPSIYNSSLRTSSIMASTITVSNINAGNISAISTGLQSNLYVPFIYNSSLQTSSIMASTVTAAGEIAGSRLLLNGAAAYGLIYMKGSLNETAIMMNDPANANPVLGYTGWYLGQSLSWGTSANTFGIGRVSAGQATANTGLWITADGKVGIGKPVPAYNLDVNGTTNISGSNMDSGSNIIFAGSTSGYFDAAGTSARFSSPTGLAADSSGNIYVTDLSNDRIRKISSEGEVTTLAGSGVRGFANGTGVTASFYAPYSLGVDSARNVYVADTYNHRIRKITPEGVVTTLAGSGVESFADGTGAAAAFSRPYGIAVDSTGNVYVADTGNNRIRKVTPGGVVTTLAGSGNMAFADGIGAAAAFNLPHGIAVDSSGILYVADTHNYRVRKVTIVGQDVRVTTFAGNGVMSFASGIGTGASFNIFYALTVDSFGNVFVADTNNNKIRGITPMGVVDTFMDGIIFPQGITVDSSGNMYVSDTINNRIRKLVTVKSIDNRFIINSGVAFRDLTSAENIRKKAQIVISQATNSGTSLLIGSAFTGGTGAGSVIQSSDYSSGFENPKDLYLNPLGGNVIIGGNSACVIGEDIKNTRLTMKAPGRGDFTHYYTGQDGGGLTTDSYQLYWYPTAGQGGLGGAGTLFKVFDLNPVLNYWDIFLPVRMRGNREIPLFSLTGTSAYGLLYMKGHSNDTAILFNDPVNATSPSGYTGWSVGQSSNWTASNTSFGIGRLTTGGAVAGIGLWITVDGKVGIGKPAPVYELDVSGEIAGTRLSLNGANGVGRIYMKGNDTQTTIVFNDPAAANPNPGYTGWFVGQDISWGAANTSFGISRMSGSGAVANTGLWITVAGKVGIGKPAPVYELDVSGNARAASFVTTSDARIKTNISTIDSPLEKVMRMRGVYYNHIHDSNTRHVGVIAQEVEEVLPEVVFTDTSENNNKSVAYGNIVALLIEAVKSQQSTIDSLLLSR
jgi:sugar lactone lactonase YvrE